LLRKSFAAGTNKFRIGFESNDAETFGQIKLRIFATMHTDVEY
jgi:hypothetical protein